MKCPPRLPLRVEPRRGGQSPLHCFKTIYTFISLVLQNPLTISNNGLSRMRKLLCMAMLQQEPNWS